VIQRRLAGFVAALLPTGPDDARAATVRTRVVALVGATGVGKTSTAVKLAADCTLRRHGRAALVTLDGGRAGALERLGAYADVLNIPLRSAETPEQVRAALVYLRDRDLVLIDTSGCHPADAGAMSALAGLLGAAGACEIHLVLPACGSRSSLLRTIDGFSALHCSRVVFTKLDEAVGCGVMLECLRRAKMRLSYVSAGPNAMDDLAAADARRLAELILSPAPAPGNCGAPR
jgi:flagellar biosynthesis protein FlhF